ncbi:enoyl-ACP reductase FabI [Neorhizobium alkalisoli]|jgi:enoyl-[acyl-carrier protein] reductase I|uniref:enoyl-[acyl-carrier-protein] reductase (NADH) n=1 Tax=Neorhizobium alkalisoli TaxID=528178 RepID=A0A561QVF8_9HYPH|nr:enoyl-ACP reductase FabI [Neorhizobium alkalisoli]TWF54354.1 enoyl-[acyl-carrier-protein] reductase [NADH] [Neorhizobium alkalisoli]
MKALIVGVANEHSLAWGCAKALRARGVDLAITYQNAKAEPHVRPLAEEIGAEIIMPLDVGRPEEMSALFGAIKQRWGRLDFMLHAIAFAPKADLHGRVVDCSPEGFSMAMDISCHSLIRMVRHAEPLMEDSGSVVTLSYLGAERAVSSYGMMGPVKAALESSVRYLASELGEKGIRVNALSAGPVRTRAASGLVDLDGLIEDTLAGAPIKQLVTIDQVGAMAAFLMSPEARYVTGQTIYVDGGYSIAA